MAGILTKIKISSLRSFIMLVTGMIITLSLLITGTYFYRKTAEVLVSSTQNNIEQQLKQINHNVEDKIQLIDSIYPFIMSNSTIRDALDPAASLSRQSLYERRLAVEKELSYLLISTYLWNEKFINAVYIVDNEENLYNVSLYRTESANSGTVEDFIPALLPAAGTLSIETQKDVEQSIFFFRNIYSMHTGNLIGTIIIDINQEAWINSYMENIDDGWIVYLLNDNLHISSNKQLTDEFSLNASDYFIVSRQMENGLLTSIVAAPKKQVFSELNHTLSTFLVLFAVIIVITILFSLSISRLITLPIERMIVYVKAVSQGNRDKELPPQMYAEFNELSDAFHTMLNKLDTYYAELYEKKILLKNAEITSLRSQMDPHFLFNVLDTVAWKAAMAEQDDIYQMIVSLGELLRANTLSREVDYITLEEELKYVKFYMYLQQMRFEDKFTIEIIADPELSHFPVPRFCIQPLVENAIVHGLEPKPGPGKLTINIINNPKYVEIGVIDNGIGFREEVNILTIKPSGEDSHTHIGLKNLDKRLSLLYGPSYHLNIASIPERYTAVSFLIPKQREEN